MLPELRRPTRRVVSRLSLSSAASRAQHLFNNGVKGIAIRALDPQEVPIASVALCFTVIAHDVDDTLEVAGHWMLSNISSTSLPSCRHRLLRHNCLLANWTAIIEAGELAEAMSMNGMSARQILGRLTRREHVLATNRAVVLIFVLEALVSVKHTHRDAHATFIAMSECVDTANTAKPTLHAMERLFGL